jgi:hypothetical protein
MILRHVLALCAVLMFVFANLAAAKEVTCRANKGGSSYFAKIAKSEGKIESFFYGDMESEGATCEVTGSRQKVDSTWVSQNENQSLVSLTLDGKEYAKVLLVDTDPVFTIKILSPLSAICGIHGYIERTVVVTTNKKNCKIQN